MQSLIGSIARTLNFDRAGENRAENQRLHQLLGGLIDMDTAEAARHLASRLPAILAASRSAEHRLTLLDAACDTIEGLLPAIERQVESAGLPLPADLIDRAIAADNLIKSTAADYQNVAFELALRRRPNDNEVLGRAALAASRLLLRRQWLACRAGKTPSASTWRRMHRLYRLAHDRGCARTRGTDGQTVEACYLAAVLLAWVDPARSPRADFAAIQRAIERLAPLAALHDDEGPDESRVDRFLIVSPQDPRPRIGHRDSSKRGAAWRIDLGQIIERLQVEIRMAELGNVRAGDGSTPLRVLNRLLESCRRQPVRRFTRQGMRPRVDLVTGFDDLWWALSRPEPSHRRTRSLAPRPESEATEWAIVDESAVGFGLCQVRGQRPDIDVGDVIGVGMRDLGRLHLCIVRRVAEDRRRRCLIGVQLLGPDGQAIAVVGNDSARQEAVLLLSRLPASGGLPGMVVRSGRLAQGDVVRELGAAPGTSIAIREAIEDNERHALHVVVPGGSRV